ncbi:MAG: DNA polymerase III subunit delta [Rhodospirillaceae bacterium]|nr:DNA polymerase III subunit delta [Rhodospirillaceae bacterium]|tara:strand:- start:31216 stop:32253 length:1038 start_codon:yes stop_codon:yes gene_type:complete
MKISAAKAPGFISSPPDSVRAILLYGPDTGLVRERTGMLTTAVVDDPKDPFRIADIQVNELREDAARLSDEAAALSFTGGRRVVRVRDVTDVTAGPIIEFCAAPVGDALVIVEAGNLGPRSKLRKSFEDTDFGAAIPCYGDEGKALRDVIAETLGKSNIRVSADAMSYLLDNLGNDRMVSRSELEKLRLYMGEESEVSLEDAAACVGDSAAMALDDIAFAAGFGNIDKLTHLMDRMRREGTAAITVLRAVARHFQRLHFASGSIDDGKSADIALKALRPPVFFKQADSFRAQLRIWPTNRLGQVIESLAEAEVQCKSTGMAAETVCDQTMLRIGAMARALRGQNK